ncbi:MAG: hypothetical protein MRERC_4c017 [Mycoplasmataceae bacterium RC_NB112A]|nr:MAG: hypothetical protein MRERC_4c017 [Mycoplasmataceae bacterium RC_NB112A]
MAEVKIDFVKEQVKKISEPNMPANVKALELKGFSTDDLSKFYEKIPSTFRIEEIKIFFYDGMGEDVYNELLDDNKVFFKISWEKEKVNFYLIGETNFKEDKTKPTIDLTEPRYSESKVCSLAIGSSEKPFVGIVKIEYKGDKPLPNKDKTSDLEKEITNLKNQIKTFKEKQNQTPNNSNDYQDYEDRIKRLENELKEKEKEKERQKTQKGDNFPWKPVIIGGVIVGGVIIVLAIILLLKKIIKD